MPQKRKQRPPPIEDPPTASSSESEEDDEEVPPSQPHATPAAVPVSSSGEEEDSSQEEDEQPSTLRTSANPPSNPQPKFSSESESDTDSEPTRAKPKPTDQTQTQTQRSPAPAKSGSKRPAHFTEPKRAKKKPTDAPSSSVANDETEEDGKKSGGQTKMFQRIWSFEDELCTLKGMNEFFSKTGQDPYRNAEPFYNFIRKSLHVEVSSNQLKEKIRRLKKKFQNHLDREKKGLEPRSTKHHDEAVLEYSKKVWGGGALMEKPKPNGKAAAKSKKKEEAVKSPAKLKAKTPEKSSAPPEFGNDDVSLLYREMSCFQELDEVDMKRGLALIEESKRKELEGKWKILRLAEMEVLANRSLLIGEQIKLVSEALQSSNN